VPEATAVIPAGTGHSSAISDLFGGELQTSLKCTETEEAPEVRPEHFIKLVCHINNNTAFLIHGLKEGLEETLTKRSQILDRDATYIRTSRISRLPHYLTVQFMRFFWRSDTGVKAKIVKPVEFPFILDVFDLCTPELQEKLKPQRRLLEEADEKKQVAERERKKKKTDDENAPAEAAQPADARAHIVSPPEIPFQANVTGKYELAAVLTHKGRTADSGHYISWVKQAENEWLKFDDEKVSVATNEDIKKLDGKGGGDWHIAYLCLYRPYNPAV